MPSTGTSVDVASEVEPVDVEIHDDDDLGTEPAADCDSVPSLDDQLEDLS